jgi:hyaluronan synthase
VIHEYDIPDAVVARPRPALQFAGVAVVIALAVARHAYYIARWPHYRLITVIWTVSFAVLAAQWVVSWFERPYTATPAQQAWLDRLRVTVNVPVYNEEPVILDRVIYALFSQTRLPDRVDVIDDGSTKEDYSEVRDYWVRHHPRSVEFNWRRYPNAGKKRAQARTFISDPAADVFVTLDSDTTLPYNALDEGLKPFADRRVYSVAGIELAWNYSRSLLTRIKGVNALVWQFTVCSAQNAAAGSVLVNRGTYALYRGDMIRETLSAYIGETLCGRPILLGDDTMLTLFALNRGRAVQQPSAACFAMYPETLSHTLRQWIRWMRGTSIRTLWRLRYLSPLSWGWWYTMLTTWGYLAFISILVAIAADWSQARSFALTALYISAAWMWLVASRMFAIRRSDQGLLDRLEAFALVPLAMLWLTFILRPIRLYGTATMLRQGWVTRTGGAETRSDADDVAAVQRSPATQDLMDLAPDESGDYPPGGWVSQAVRPGPDFTQIAR